MSRLSLLTSFPVPEDCYARGPSITLPRAPSSLTIRLSIQVCQDNLLKKTQEIAVSRPHSRDPDRSSTSRPVRPGAPRRQLSSENSNRYVLIYLDVPFSLIILRQTRLSPLYVQSNRVISMDFALEGRKTPLTSGTSRVPYPQRAHVGRKTYTNPCLRAAEKAIHAARARRPFQS